MINDKNCFFPNGIFHPALKEMKALFFPVYLYGQLYIFRDLMITQGFFSIMGKRPGTLSDWQI